jgi:hypothetical protein
MKIDKAEFSFGEQVAASVGFDLQGAGEHLNDFQAAMPMPGDLILPELFEIQSIGDERELWIALFSGRGCGIFPHISFHFQFIIQSQGYDLHRLSSLPAGILSALKTISRN